MIAYLILAHDQPDHLERLIDALECSDAHTYVHIDKKTDIRIFDRIDKKRSTWIEDRVKVYWGNWSQVEATLRLLREAVQSSDRYTHFVLLSGSDFPLRSNEELLDYLSSSPADHIDRLPFPNAETLKPIERLSRRRIDSVERQTGLRALGVRRANRLLAFLPPRNLPRILGDVEVFCGSQWWALTRASIIEVLEQIDEKSQLVSLFTRSHIPDEMFFHTMISARRSPEIGKNLTYADWSEGNASPATMDCEKLKALADGGLFFRNRYGEGPIFFARKFDQDSLEAYRFAQELRQS